ncbi:alpha/beta hydrolase YcfP [Shewanella gelidii]|uniref:UPF0227 protein n=1 Tax=Shewanella gelidii TaxID=1642821 RepID=A0A917N9U7_9GAMM|nr:alpha/beta hydrolase YcfP [Shewanella gelidii]MCL1097539.1 alpha/beta hydrolase YcfP [Shewanella gelidii]GGI76094.1 UPF0227 protein [Shewanella gelidii]
MILYFHGFDATSPGNHEKVRQLQFIDDDVRLISYSTLHPRSDMTHLLNEVKKQLEYSDDPNAIIVGVGLGGFWAERVAFLTGLRSVIINPNLKPQDNMLGRIDRPEEYEDIAAKCVSQFRLKNKGRSVCILSRQNDVHDTALIAETLAPYYDVVWDDKQPHKFPILAAHLQMISRFKGQEMRQAAVS